MNLTDLDLLESSTNPYPLWFHIILWIFMALLALATILGNLMVLLAYYIDRTLRQPSNLFIASLAVSDLIIGLEGFIVLTVYVLAGEKWLLGRLMCKLWLTLDYMLCLVSILTVLLITIDRYCSVCHTAKYRQWQSSTKVQILILFSWLIPLAFFAIMIFGWQNLTGDYAMDDTKCYAPFLNDPFLNMAMYLVYYWAVVAAMIVLYRGIHNAAKALEKRADAKERQAVAMAALQRCMAQMGVGMLISAQQKNFQSAIKASEDTTKATSEAATVIVDSGYASNQAASTTGTDEKSIEVRHAAPMQKALLEYRMSGNSQKSVGLMSIQEEPTSYCSLETYVTDKTGTCYRDVSLSASLNTSLSSLQIASHSTTMYFNLENPFQPKYQMLNTEGGNQCQLEFSPVSEVSKEIDIIWKKFEIQVDAKNEIDRQLQTEAQFKNEKIWIPMKSPDMNYMIESSSDQEPVLASVHKPFQKSDDHAEINTELTQKLVISSNNAALQAGVKRRNWVSMRLHKAACVMSPKIKPKGNSSLKKLPPKKLNLSKDLNSQSKTGNTTTGDENAYDSEESSSDNSNEPENKCASSEKTTNQQQPGHAQNDQNFNQIETDLITNQPITSKTRKASNLVSQILSTPAWLLGRKRKKTRAERRARKAFRTITIILGAFVLFWSPYFIFATVYGFCDTCISMPIFLISYYMCYLNSTVNPFCYALANRQFRNAFVKILQGEVWHRWRITGRIIT